MLDGYRCMGRGEVFKALTPEQQLEVRKKMLARRAPQGNRSESSRRQQGQTQILPR